MCVSLCVRACARACAYAHVHMRISWKRPGAFSDTSQPESAATRRSLRAPGHVSA